MGCTEGLARILVFVANFCFVLVGLALLITGILFQLKVANFTEAVPDEYQVLQYVPIFAIIVGAVIFFIAFLGCCGALKGNTCMLTSYGAILFIIFLLQIGLGIFALVTIKDNNDLKTKLDAAIVKLFARYNAATQKSNEAVDFIQESLKCCGTTDNSSWNGNIPTSCPTAAGTPGCQEAMYNFIIDSVKLIGIIALSVSIVEVVGAVLSLCLSNCIRGRERQGAYY